MGAWGYGIYDNDTAMDCVSDYDDYVKNGLEKQAAMNELVDSWYMKDNYSILAIADLQIKNFGKLDDNVKVAIKKVINEELENVKEWRSPEERKNEIELFYSRIKSFM